MTAAAPPRLVWDWRAELAQHDPRLLADPEGRRVLTRTSPSLFALVYFRGHLAAAETGGRVSFSRFHTALAESARQWIRDDLGPAELREAWVAPRGSGKSTWLFSILPCWALAHRHRNFVAAFADSGHQAQQHLASLKREFDTNALLRRDYPELCKAAYRPSGTSVADNQSLYVAGSGVVFQAKGIDSSTLGAKVGSQRPDLLLFDDVEPDASNYSMHQKAKRQETIVNAVLPMNLNAVVQFAGTTTMHGSIIHDIVRQTTDPENAPEWVRDEHIRTRYFPAIVTDDDGSEASLWPERWDLEYLQSIRHTRSFALNMQNVPTNLDGDFWTQSDFRYDPPPAVTRRILSIDPAVTTKTTSDYSGLAVVGFDPVAGRCVVQLAVAVKLGPAALRQRVLAILEANPGIRAVLVESNQGGQMWHEVLSPLPVKILTLHQTEPKPVRAARVLDYYQMGWVAHSERLAAFEEQAMAYPGVAHDDLVDAVGSGLHFFLSGRKRPRQAATTQAYA